MEKFRKLINNAIENRSSDLFILPYQNRYRILTCVQGKKSVVRELTANEGHQMIAYF